MSYIPATLRDFVFERAKGRCEYCRLPDKIAVASHEVDHIYATKHGGETTEENLCLSCWRCNRFKGTDLASLDPDTGEPTFLYHPRRDIWSEHFRLENGSLIGLTPAGRATARLLTINAPDRVIERAALIRIGRYP